MALSSYTLTVYAESAGAVRAAFFGGVASCCATFLFAGDGMYRKVWIAVLTVLTVAFLVALAVLSEPRPTAWMTDKEVDELVYQDMIEKGFVDPTTGKINILGGTKK